MEKNNKSHIKIVGSVVVVLLFIIFSSFPVEARAGASRILLINSYDQRMPWVADIIKGVEDVIKPEKNGYSLYIENMDSKEFHHPDYFEVFRNYLEVKYRHVQLDLIFSSDNNAYDFLRKNRDVLFPGVPVVFCGVNNFEEQQLNGLDGFTGIAEIFSAAETINLAFQLQPKVSRVYVINDYLKTGRLWSKDINTALLKLQEGRAFKIEHSPDVSRAELLEKVAGFSDDTVVLLGAYFSDRNDEPVRYEKIASLLSEASSVPVYCLVEFIIDEGMIGGHVISGYYQGYSMAQLGLNILIGADPGTIPVLLKGSNKPIINYEQLVRFGLNESLLPGNVEIVKKPYSFYQHYKREIWVVVAFILSLLVAIMALVINTGRLKRAKTALKGSEEQLRQLANATWEALIIHDNGLLLQANELFEEMFGYQPEEFLGRKFLPYIFSEESYREVLEKLEVGDVGLYEAQGKKNDGTVFPTEVRVRKMKYHDRYVRVVAIRDLTERKDMEEQLAQSQKLEAIGTLAGGIAHDFNNILSAIIGYSELTMLNLPKDSLANKNINHILKAGNRAKTLIQQILTFAHKSEQKQEPVNVAKVIGESMKLLRASMPTSIEIITNLASDSFVLGDPTKIHQVVMNLCTNAGKAMADGGVLTVMLKDVDIEEWFVARYPDIQEGAYVRLTVSDTGTGIPDEIRSRIFDPFFTTRKKEDGTGLGLSVVHGIVKEAGGLITVQSENGNGTVFDVYLPVLKTHEHHLPDLQPSLSRGSERIMLIDDESDLIDVGLQTLRTLGYKVEGFQNSLDALAAFRERPFSFDLVITDMTMPRMGGDKVAASLLSIRPEIPVIIYTGYSENFTEKEALRMGVRQFLFKPVDIATLAESVRKILDAC